MIVKRRVRRCSKRHFVAGLAMALYSWRTQPILGGNFYLVGSGGKWELNDAEHVQIAQFTHVHFGQ